MKVVYLVLTCSLLIGCGLSPEQLTTTAVAAQTLTQKAVKTATQSPTPQPNLTETKKANQAATQTKRASNAQATRTEIAKPTLTAVAKAAMTLNEIKNTAVGANSFDFSKAKLVYGPSDNTLVHELNNQVIVYNPRLSLRNFIVSIRYINPYDTSGTGKWDYGILFRNQYGNNQYRFIVLSNQSWTLINSDTQTYIFSSNDKNLKAKAGEENMIWLIAIDTKVYLFINGIFTKSLDITAKPNMGDISPASGLFYGNLIEKRITEYEDFMVWSLP